MAIRVKGLTKRYGKVLAVDDLSFEIAPGTIAGFLGPNGAGKTTTMRILLDLVRSTSGEAAILGRRFRNLDAPVHRVGAVLEASAFHPGRSARSHLRVLAAAAGIPRSRVDEVLEQVELAADARRRVRGFSLGMRQRLSLAAALLGDPDVLVLDEPANGLDPAGMRWLRDLLRSLAGRGRTVFVSSHVLAEVEQIADEVVIIHRGRFVAHAPVHEVLARAGGGIRVRTPDAERLLAVLGAEGVEAKGEGSDRLRVTGAPIERVGEIAAANGVVLHELAAEASTLEDAFLALTAEGEQA